MNAPPPPNWTPCVSIMVNVEIGGSPTDAQRAAIDRALDQISQATGAWYRDAATTTQIPQYNSVDSIPMPLEIWVGPRSASDLLQVDGSADEGFTHWSENGHAAIALLDSTFDGWFQALTMHELLLSRHLVEYDDGGLLGHRFANLDQYPAQDLELMRP